MPRVLIFGRFVLFFWSAEEGEPIHIHVSVKVPSPNSVKYWLLSDGGCELAYSDGSISSKELRRIQRFITLNHEMIVKSWAEFFGPESVRFYR